MKELPLWMKTEDDVKTLFSFYGFNVMSVSIEGRQIDLIAKRNDTFNIADEIWIVEITTEKVDSTKGSKDYEKLALAQKTDYPNAKLMIITTDSYTDDQKRSLQKLGVNAFTYEEFESKQLDLSKIAAMQIRTIRLNERNDVGYNPNVYIEPSLSIRLTNDELKEISVKEWVESSLINTTASLCALLGNLGSGKTSLLQHLVLLGCDEYLANPNSGVLPLYIPLGKYKQHSGNIDQMIMSQLKDYGFFVYPMALINYLIFSRRIILLLDGLDEIHPIQNSNDVLETVTTILSNIGETSLSIISCRKQFLETTSDELAYFGSYTTVHMQKIQNGLSRLLRGHPTSYIAYINPFDIERIYSYLNRRCSLTKEQIDQIFKKYYGFKELSTTPVLLSMIATTVSEQLIKPDEQIDYPLIQLYEAYTNRWIERDIGRAKLSVEQRRRLSENLANYMLWEQKERADWLTIQKVLHEDPYWKENSLTDAEAEIDIRNSGFLIREFDDSYKFVHRSIMEYFGAQAELGKIKLGIKPREFPTDGYRSFILQLISREWIKNDIDVFPESIWAINSGETILSSISNTLAAVTSNIPSSGKKYIIRNRKNILINDDQAWYNCTFINSRIKVLTGSVIFKNVVFSETYIDINTNFIFKNCTFDKTTLSMAVLPVFENESAIGIILNAQQAAYNIPLIIWYLSDLLSRGLNIVIDNKKYQITFQQLNFFFEVISRIKGKIFIGSWKKGKTKNAHELLLEELIRKGYVDKDTSREGHQIKISHLGNEFLAKLKTNPLAIHDEIFGLLVKYIK